MRDKKVLFIVQAAVIAAIYVVLTEVFAAFSFNEVQVRISEGLTILPYFTPAAIPGLFVGCIIANLLGGAVPMDIVFGSLATLIGALGSYALRRYKFLVPVPPILSNTIIVPLILRFGYGIPSPIWLMMLTVGIGEVISCGMIGIIMLLALEPYKKKIFGVPSASAA